MVDLWVLSPEIGAGGEEGVGHAAAVADLEGAFTHFGGLIELVDALVVVWVYKVGFGSLLTREEEKEEEHTIEEV
jgi:hypothetical protein